MFSGFTEGLERAAAGAANTLAATSVLDGATQVAAEGQEGG